MLIQENILNKGINVYNVSCIYETKDSNEIVSNLFAQTFKKQIEADNYFRMLYTKYASKSENEVEYDIESSLK